MEIWDLYDSEGNKTGETWERKFGKNNQIPEGRYHLVCDILVKHDDGTFLLTKRSPAKDVYPGRWEASAGGSALSGEGPLECAKRELFEETGISTDRFFQIGTSRREQSRSMFGMFVAETDCDKDSVKLQDGETVDYKWVTRDELLAHIGTDDSIPTHDERYRKYYDKILANEILASRPTAPWLKDVDPDDFVSPYPTYPCGTILDRFKKCEYTGTDGTTLKYYFFEPAEAKTVPDKKFPLLVFFHGAGNSFVGDLCVNYTGAERYACDDYQASMGGAYILVPIANEFRNEEGRTCGTWSPEYDTVVRELVKSFIEQRSGHIGLRFFLGNSAGGRYVFHALECFPEDADVVIPVGSSEIPGDKALEEFDDAGKHLFFAMGKRDEINDFNSEVVPRLSKLSSLKNCFIFTPEWVRNGDKGIASINGGIEMGQHCLMNGIQANLMFDDGTPMDERLPQGLTGWIAEVVNEKSH